MTTTKVQNHINEKFEKFANSHHIAVLEAPTMCNIVIFASTKGKTQHMAALAKKDDVLGYLINLGDKQIKFFPTSDVRCKPLKNGSLVKGKARLIKNKDGQTFSAV